MQSLERQAARMLPEILELLKKIDKKLSGKK